MIEKSKDDGRSVFEAYMLGREHPVFGWIDGHWFGRGDDPATYANDYVQGCWVMWQTRASLPVGVSDGWPHLERPAKVGAGVFSAGLSARLVVEAAYRQHEYAAEPPFSDGQINSLAMLAAAPTVKESLSVAGVPAMSAEAMSTLRGMVDYCLNARVCMGMDEGFASFDPEIEHDFVKELRAFSEGAPTVKAEQVQCLYCQGHGDVTRVSGQTAESYSEHNEECPECKGTGLAPSLPAAGSAVDRVVATAPERIYLIIGDDCPRDADFSELGEVAWCEEEAEQGIEYVRAALSAQQSSPERVSVPEGWSIVEKPTCFALLEGNQVIATLAGPDAEENASIIAALLASHGRGEA
ncbi:hypothetical protein [Leptolyngbya phage Lbo-JY16]